jgi:hypothetical protein
LISAIHIRVGDIPSIRGPYVDSIRSAVGSPSDAHQRRRWSLRRQRVTVRAMTRGDPHRHPVVVVDQELLDLAGQVHRHRVAVHAGGSTAGRGRPGLTVVDDPRQVASAVVHDHPQRGHPAVADLVRSRRTSGGAADQGKSIQASVRRQA